MNRARRLMPLPIAVEDLLERPDPDALYAALQLLGRLLLGGTAAFRDLPAGFGVNDLPVHTPVRCIFAAMCELVAQGKHRKWFSVLAIAREIDRAARPGFARNHLAIYFWCRSALTAAIFRILLSKDEHHE